jgi:hypothetical protein
MRGDSLRQTFKTALLGEAVRVKEYQHIPAGFLRSTVPGGRNARPLLTHHTNSMTIWCGDVITTAVCGTVIYDNYLEWLVR